jgi:hypothetical protein
MRLPARQPVAGRRSRRAKRPRRLVNWTRLFGVALMALAALAGGWLLSADDFVLDETDVAVNGLQFADGALVRAIIDPLVADQPSLFRLSTAELEEALLRVPAVARAEVSLVLPARLEVVITERTPVFVWQTAEDVLLVDGEGAILRPATADELAAGRWPTLNDSRAAFAPPVVDDRLDPLDLEVTLKLLAVDPALVGSPAAALVLSADDEDGYVLTAEPDGWRAVFGHYTPNLRPPEIIDRQVQCLRSLLADDQGELTDIYLAPADDRCGTFRARPSASPSAP